MPATAVREPWIRPAPAASPAGTDTLVGPFAGPPGVWIRPWRGGDERLLVRAAAAISPTSLRNRFLAGVPRLPEAYLRRIATLPRTVWDAQVAIRDGCPDGVIGWAEFVRTGNEAEADLAILVLDAWQRRGVGRALVGSLLPRAAAAGIRTLHADIDLSNEAARRLLASVLGRDRLAAQVVDGLLHYTMTVPATTVPARPTRTQE
jgi:GNAT superfamily N-acetyltransferase